MDKNTLFRRRDARIGVTMPKELREELDAVAEAQGVHLSAIVRLALVDYFKKLEATNKKRGLS